MSLRRASIASLREQFNSPDDFVVFTSDRAFVLALLETAERARDLADLAAHVVCEPRRFLENTDGDQQLLGEAVARTRAALAHFRFDHQSNEPAASPAGSATGSSTEKGV